MTDRRAFPLPRRAAEARVGVRASEATLDGAGELGLQGRVSVDCARAQEPACVVFAKLSARYDEKEIAPDAVP